MRKLGLTGGIGSGKSTVARMLADLGAAIVDADAISRSTTAAGGSAIAAIAAQFGPDFIAADGALDRERMRQQVFSNPEAKRRLEAIIHPLVAQAIAQQTQAAGALGARCVVYDIPLLVESAHWRPRLDRVLVVDCTEATQMQRVMQRNGLAQPEVEKIIASQASRAQRLAAADAVIFNDGIDLGVLAQHVRQCSAHFGL